MFFTTTYIFVIVKTFHRPYIMYAYIQRKMYLTYTHINTMGNSSLKSEHIDTLSAPFFHAKEKRPTIEETINNLYIQKAFILK